MNKSFFTIHKAVVIYTEIKFRVKISLDQEWIFLFFKNNYE